MQTNIKIKTLYFNACRQFESKNYWTAIKNLGSIETSEVELILIKCSFYLLLNCGALRAFLRPYFFLSFIRGSLVKNPFDFKAGLYSILASFKALAIPWRIAPAWPVNPPPFTVQITSYLVVVFVTVKGCLTITFKVSNPKNSSISFPFIVIFPEPSTNLTLATEDFLLPVP